MTWTTGAISESLTFDVYGAEQTYTVTANDGSLLYAVDYGTRDALGRIVNTTETVQGETNKQSALVDLLRGPKGSRA